jgi:hypothetical protein
VRSITVVASPLTLPSGGNYGLSVKSFGGEIWTAGFGERLQVPHRG